MHPGQVDDLEIPVIAALLGVGSEVTDPHAAAMSVNQARMAHAADVERKVETMRETGTYTAAELADARRRLMAEFTWDGATR